MSEGAPYRVDLHVKTLDESVVERAAERGLDALVYAPHFTRLPDVVERAERFATDEVTVIPGRELLTGHWNARAHLLAVGLTDPVPDYITLAGAVAELRRQDATALVPHPGFMHTGLTGEQVTVHADALDAVEVDNAKFLPHHRRRARRVSAENNLPGYAASYAHLPGSVGECWTAFDRPVRSAEDLATALAADAHEVGRRAGLGARARQAGEFGHLFWEATWGKADRILLQGTEPTHPSHVAYDRRFEDVRVY